MAMKRLRIKRKVMTTITIRSWPTEKKCRLSQEITAHCQMDTPKYGHDVTRLQKQLKAIAARTQ